MSNPPQFHFCLERSYSAVNAGDDITFTHYQLTPTGQFSKAVADAVNGTLITHERKIEPGGNPNPLNSIAFKDCEIAVGSMFAGQCALKCFVEDEQNTINQRCDAMMLFAWIGSLEATIDELVAISPWASEFIFESMKSMDRLCKMIPTF